MIKAWVLYYDGDRHHLQELDGTGGFASTEPADWGLDPKCSILLTFQQAQFVDAWLYGELVRRW